MTTKASPRPTPIDNPKTKQIPPKSRTMRGNLQQTLGNKKKQTTETIAHLQAVGLEERWAIPFKEIEFKKKDKKLPVKQFDNWEEFDHGAGGSIFRVRWRKLECVAKTCPVSVGNNVLRDLANEIRVLSTLRHPNLVMFLGACFHPKHSPILLMEFCSGGNLERRLTKLTGQQKKLNSKLAFKYTREIALAMNFLHQCDPPVIHRDLKPSNILLTESGAIKVTDFGLSKFIPKKNMKERERYHMTGETGSYRFMAPEVFRHEDYDVKVDVYSFALIVYWVAVGHRPFADIVNPVEACRAASKGERKPYSKNIKPLWFKTLLEQAWSFEAKDRPTFDDICDEIEKHDNLKAGGDTCSIA